MHTADPHARAEADRLRPRTRILWWIFIIGLVVNGVTAFPIPTELQARHSRPPVLLTGEVAAHR